MNEQAIQSIVEEIVSRLQDSSVKEHSIPMAVSARHCHVSQKDLEILFGTGYQLTKKLIYLSPANSLLMKP